MLEALKRAKANIWLESALQIKKLLGLQRGKNDRVDSLRIAQYAYLHRSSFQKWQEPRACIQQLKHLSTMRTRLIGAYHQLQVCLKENEGFLKKGMASRLRVQCKKSLTSLLEDPKHINLAILTIIEKDEALKHLYEIVCSVDFAGPVLATELIIVTNEFKAFSSPKKFACYCGVAPFEHTSGTSVRGKTRVSGLANKRVKAILHMAAIGAISHKGFLQDYYQRKVAEGHPKMSVLNAVRNKIIHRVFACIRDQRVYQKALPVKIKVPDEAVPFPT